MSATRTDERLWEAVKAEVMADGKRWNARKAQLAVRLYEQRGGGYVGPKPTAKQNRLVKWTREEWGYVGDKPGGRYLPRKVREALPPDLAAKENRRKKAGKTPNVPYADETVELMRKLRIF